MNFFLGIKIFFRSLFLQSVWNYERMQNVGFVFSLIPFINHLYKDKTVRAQKIKTHFGFFNTHPYLANLLLGIVMRLEEKCLKNEVSQEEVLRTKTMLAGPIAAIGDRFIWSTWRVVCSFIGVAYYLCSGKEGVWYQANIFVGILLFLLIYNLLGHLPLRILSIYWGYKYTNNVVDKISKFALQSYIVKIRNVGIIILLFASFIYSISLISDLKIVLLFWLNILLSLLLSKKIAEVGIFYILFLLNIIILTVTNL